VSDTQIANPYTRHDYELLKTAQRKLHDLLPIIDKCKKCGIPCSDYESSREGMLEALLALEEEFFTPPPTK